MAEGHASDRAETTDHELSDLSPKNISLFGLGLAALLIVALAVVYGIMVWFRHSAAARAERPVPLAVTTEPRAAPQLLVDPGQSMKQMRQQEDSRLKSYGWIDEEKGIVHIPIDRAIEMLAKKGLPARTPRAQGESASSAEAGTARQERQP
jgi:uncharacterized protein (DUF58 family)